MIMIITNDTNDRDDSTNVLVSPLRVKAIKPHTGSLVSQTTNRSQNDDPN